MKILNFPQYSMFNGVTFEIDRDSTTAVYKVLKKYLGSEHQLIQLIPEDQYEFTYGINHIPYPLVNSPLLQRFDFDSRTFMDLISSGEFDLVFNHVPELARNMKACMPRLPVISFHHFPDIGVGLVPEVYSYFSRQVDGYTSSDMNVFNMDTNRMKFLEASKMDPSNSFAISYLDTELYYRVDDRHLHRLTLFPGRITSTNYNNWKAIVDLFIKADGKLGTLVLTNPSGKYGMKAFRAEYPSVAKSSNIVIYESGLGKEAYRKACQQADAVVSLYENEFYGGLAIREAILWGHAVPITLHVNEFAKWNNRVGLSSFKTLNDLTIDGVKRHMELADADAYHAIVMNEDYTFYKNEFNSRISGS